MSKLTKALRIPLSPCWHCKHAIDSVTTTGERRMPEPGDVAVCIICAEINVYDENLIQRRPTDEEYLEAAAQDDVKVYRETIRRAAAEVGADKWYRPNP